MIFPIRNLSGDWTKWLSSPEIQASLQPFVDTNGCALFALTHFLEMTQYQLTGTLPDLSERGLCKLAGLDKNVDASGHIWGSYVESDLKAVKTYGIPAQSVWPDLTNFTLAEFFTPLSQAALNSGKDWLKHWVLSDLIPVSEADVPQVLKTSPILLEIQFPNGATHLVVRINETQYFDSYSPFVKPVGYNGSKIINQWIIILMPNFVPFGYKVADNPTVYVQTTGGALIPLTDPGAFLNMGGVLPDDVITITQDQLNKRAITADIFKSNV